MEALRSLIALVAGVTYYEQAIVMEPAPVGKPLRVKGKFYHLFLAELAHQKDSVQWLIDWWL